MYKSIFIVTVFFLASCQKEVEYDFPVDKPRLSLYSILQPTDTLRFVRNDTPRTYVPSNYAALGRSMSLFDIDSALPVDNPPLTLHKEGKLISQFTPVPYMDNNHMVYRSEAGLNTGSLYQIKASVDGFPGISANVRIPDTIQILEAVFDTVKNEIHFSFKDPPGQNYYKFYIESRSPIIIETSDPSVVKFNPTRFDSILIPRIDNSLNFNTERYMEDKAFSNQIKTVTLRIVHYFQEIEVPEITVELYNLSPDYYEFLRTFTAYYSTKDNPFAERVQIHSNVENGLGLVGAVSMTRKMATKK